MVAWREAAKYTIPFLWTFVPIYLTEKLADFFFLEDNTASFYFMSGWRLILFIAFALAGSVAAGALVKNAWRGALTQWTAVALSLVMVFYACDPRVCFSSGPDSLEPLRLGFFLGSVSFSGAALGARIRHGEISRSAEVMAGFFGCAAVGFYPVVFTFAGAGVLPPFHPWGAAGILALVSFPIALGASVSYGPRAGFAIPVASAGTLFLLSVGIATSYLQQVAFGAGVIALSVVIGAAAGSAMAARRREGVRAHRHAPSVVITVGVVAVLSMMLFTTPDAVNGVVPTGGQGQTSYEQGVPVYGGGAMTGPAGHSEGARVSVSFGGTNASAIQEDNFLSAGMGIHAAGCCVDGIDYSYRYDLYLYHSGNESMVASAWEVCDDNAACGGHSWKVLLFLRAHDIGRVNLGENVTLEMAWQRGEDGPEVAWSYFIQGGTPTNFTSFTVPKAENLDFNTAILPGGTTPQQASYFFQFGVMSRYPIGHGGWSVDIFCPAVLVATWRCVDHAMTLAGDQSFWKIFWRWGEDYPGVSVSSPRIYEIAFGYAEGSTPSFRGLW